MVSVRVHPARIVWAYVSGLDLSELYAQIQAFEGGPGQAPPDPRILLAPMIAQHEQRYDATTQEMLVDGGFVKKADIDAVSAPQGSNTVYAPVMKSKDPAPDSHPPRDDVSPAVAEWCQRTATAAAKTIYQQRTATAECVNAWARNRGLQRFLVRGLAKVKAVALWHALVHNLMRAATLRLAGTARAQN